MYMYVFPRELNVGSFTTFLGVDLLNFDPVMLLMMSDDGCILERLLTFPQDRVSLEREREKEGCAHKGL